MFRYYLTLALRNLRGNKLTKFVKIIGMAMAIVVSMIILLFVHYEQNYDRFFSNHENVYWLINTRKTTKGNETVTGTPIPIVNEILQNVPK
ncbi:MAG: hypothetical protein HQ541_08700 [Mariniphaga sp.]|nr:hypothetical protein [Mariniphaga sp.]